MWDYDKLFAEGNIVGLHNVREGETYGWTVVDKRHWNQSEQINWQDYFNSNLTFDTGLYLFEVQYIIRLDDKGRVAKRLFDRDKDMPKSKLKPMPELESGMFVTVFWKDGYESGINLGYVDKENNHIIYLSGGYDNLNTNWDKNYRIVEVYRKNTRGFRYCTNQNLIWREPNYVHKDFNIGKE